MIVSIDECSSDPLYKQIHDQIIAGIATGELEPGMSLPSVRSLASDLGINLHTVNKAYAVLRDEGYVQMRGRSGAVISEPNDASRADKTAKHLRLWKTIFLSWRLPTGRAEVSEGSSSNVLLLRLLAPMELLGWKRVKTHR